MIDHLETGLSGSGNAVFGYADPTTSDTYPGWPLRNLLCLIGAKFGRRRFGSADAPLRFVGLRQKSLSGGRISVDGSIVIDVFSSDVGSDPDKPIIKGNLSLGLSL